MKYLLLTLAAGGIALAGDPEPRAYALLDPNSKDEVLVVLEHQGDHAAVIWDAEDEQFGEVKKDRGEVLEPTPFGVKLIAPGDMDTTRKAYPNLDAIDDVVFKVAGEKDEVFANSTFPAQGLHHHRFDLEGRLEAYADGKGSYDNLRSFR